MGVVNPAKQFDVKDTSSVNFAGTTASTDNEKTLGVKFGPYTQFGFWIDISAAGGTTPTLDVEFEWSEDSTDGVDGTWAALVENGEGSATQSQLAQITTTTGAFAAYFTNPCSNEGWIRANLNLGGTSPAYDIDKAVWVAKNAAPDR